MILKNQKTEYDDDYEKIDDNDDENESERRGNFNYNIEDYLVNLLM